VIVFSKNARPYIEAHLQEFSPVERKIADYFLGGGETPPEETGKALAKRLGVSEAALTRFSQKCGFRGLRELFYAHNQTENHGGSDFVQPVLASYQELLNKTYAIIDMRQIRRITALLLHKKRVYIYGKGSSGMVAQEMKFRFMRIGLICEAITDDDMIRMTAVLTDPECLAIGISISGRSKIIIEALQTAKSQGAATVLLTANADREYRDTFDEVQLFAVKNQMEHGRLISPQFPALVVLDILYADYMNHDAAERDRIWQRTYRALQRNKEQT